MFENNLITITDIQEYKALSKNTDTDKKVNPFIQEAQEFDLRLFMGDEFYLKLVEQFKSLPTPFPNQNYKDLFEGSIWTKNGRTYENPGLKSVLVYWSYARYLNKANTNSTAFGMVGKNNPDSTPITDRTIDRLVGQSNSGASAYLNRVEHFIECNSSLFPEYDCGVDPQKNNSFKISAAGGNNSRRKKYDPITKKYYY
jgi:hypothetical protein